ncbi:uncharacterized protein MYCFIDRAFT_174879 [Pseudocercospora fijiensis CIRAD86]|uniref:Uncharacterized protein n=1 Tax=Pseudocercospora fijiensis (strain CIRAD86) TaxID=383855 RepID=M2ZWS1_PSEFD|nr:uncharacterized protein MYCFIDRAFT_174879 [Pseudocercospora fijiensis CIRAD86]EME83444.1 hypothetical protein MYCFIDRAFT_174879 [Pseudocercospora fijiensis CIRAD86]
MVSNLTQHTRGWDLGDDELCPYDAAQSRPAFLAAMTFRDRLWRLKPSTILTAFPVSHVKRHFTAWIPLFSHQEKL